MTFVIVRQQEPYRFNTFHEDHELAIQEACRLSKAKDDTFMVLKVVGIAKQQSGETIFIPSNSREKLYLYQRGNNGDGF